MFSVDISPLVSLPPLYPASSGTAAPLRSLFQDTSALNCSQNQYSKVFDTLMRSNGCWEAWPEQCCSGANVQHRIISLSDGFMDGSLEHFIPALIVEHAEVPALHQVTSHVLQVHSSLKVFWIKLKRPPETASSLVKISKPEGAEEKLI